MKLNDLKLLKKKLVALSLISTLSLSGAVVNNQKVYAKSSIYNTIDELTNYYSNVEDFINAGVNYYSSVFNIKNDILKNEVEKLNIVSEYLYKNNDLTNEDKKKIELTICDLAYELYYKPSNFGYKNRNQISNGENYQSTLPIEEMNAKYAYLYDNERTISLAIMCAECGKDINSHNYRVNNNPAGIGGNMKFPNKEVGIIYFARMLSYNYHLKKGSDESFFSRVASTYCELPEHWLKLTVPSYRAIKNNYFVYNPELEEEIDLSIYDSNNSNTYAKK